jgi:endonuclease/exonuclease/phosphatase family metal-dependent hydrolase
MQESAATAEESRRIDSIFVRTGERGPSLRIDACDLIFAAPVNGTWASDHFGLVADFEPFG